MTFSFIHELYGLWVCHSHCGIAGSIDDFSKRQ